MKITAIKLYAVSLPVVGGEYRMASTTTRVLDSTIVELTTDTGMKGYGEVCPAGSVYQPQHALGARAALHEFCPSLIGLNPLHTETIARAMDAALNGARYAKAAVDIALWDIAGKAYNARVCDLLGGAVKGKVPSYYSTTVMPPEQTASLVAEKQREGYTRIQTKVGGRSLDEDIATIRKVGEVINTGVGWAVDVNRGWSTRDAITASRLTEHLAYVLEQPCNTYEEVVSLRNQVRHPLYLDESAEHLGVILNAAVNKTVDGFGLKVTRLGGLSSMRTVRDVCHFARLPFSCDDAWGGDIIAAACVHLAATVTPSLCEGAWIAAPYIDGHYDENGGITIKNGWIDVPAGPGLGVVPNPDAWGKPIQEYG
ncbi:mandelate racemase/muconate lactonizing enzyme family protein [Mesorhizobium sp. PL10]